MITLLVIISVSNLVITVYNVFSITKTFNEMAVSFNSLSDVAQFDKHLYRHLNGALASFQNKTDDADKFAQELNAKIQFLVKREVERWKKENQG
jgi:hypothetical protein